MKSCPSCNGAGQVSWGRLVAIHLPPVAVALFIGAIIIGLLHWVTPKVIEGKRQDYYDGYWEALTSALPAVADDAITSIQKAKNENVRWYNLGTDKAHYDNLEKAMRTFKEFAAENVRIRKWAWQTQQDAERNNPGGAK